MCERQMETFELQALSNHQTLPELRDWLHFFSEVMKRGSATLADSFSSLFLLWLIMCKKKGRLDGCFFPLQRQICSLIFSLLQTAAQQFDMRTNSRLDSSGALRLTESKQLIVCSNRQKVCPSM